MKKLTFEIDLRDAKAPSVWLNGDAVGGVDGKWPVRLVEGVNIVGLAMTIDGTNPGVKIRVAGQPDGETRWRIDADKDGGWRGAAFDDRS